FQVFSCNIAGRDMGEAIQMLKRTLTLKAGAAFHTELKYLCPWIQRSCPSGCARSEEGDLWTLLSRQNMHRIRIITDQQIRTGESFHQLIQAGFSTKV
ncbi:MAG: hypothetical protein VX399_10740, partial [SAR324 cluster bacterium]|nr:hypothetical protein [SAR324 cluster bacterium]